MRVLVVDDELNVLQLVRTVLEERGCDVVCAESGDEALVLAAQRVFDVALVDLSMPSPDWPELVRNLRAHQPALRVVLLSPYAGASPAEGSWPVLPKPFPLASLEAVVLSGTT